MIPVLGAINVGGLGTLVGVLVGVAAMRLDSRSRAVLESALQKHSVANPIRLKTKMISRRCAESFTLALFSINLRHAFAMAGRTDSKVVLA